MKEVIALIIFSSFAIVTFYLAGTKQIGPALTSIFLVFSILAGLGAANYDLVKKLEWKSLKIETFERKVNEIADDAILRIQDEVERQSTTIKNLTENAEETKREMEQLNESLYRYSFYFVSPFSGVACTGGGHAVSASWSTETDIAKMMGKARIHLDNGDFDGASEVANEIENMFPRFPGALHIKFLVSRARGNEKQALEQAGHIINLIHDHGFSAIRPSNVVDVYKFAINQYLSLDKKQKAVKIAREALRIWPDDNELLDVVQ